MATFHLDELTKVPFMLEHYKTHKASTPDFTFFDFLKHHYGNQTVYADFDDDMKLPFKSFQQDYSIQVSYLQSLTKLPDIEPTIIKSFSQITSRYIDPFGLELTVTLLQPPRAV